MKLPYRSKCFGYIGFVMALVVAFAMLMSTGLKAHKSPSVAAKVATLDSYDKPDLPAQPATVNLHQCSTIGDNPPNCWTQTNKVSKIDSFIDTAGINTFTGQTGRDWERIL